MMKKLTAIFLSVSMLLSLAVVPAVAENTEPLLAYDANAVSGEAGYLDATAGDAAGIQKYGISATDKSWSAVLDNAFLKENLNIDKNSLRIASPKAANTSNTEIAYANVAFASDTVNNPVPFNNMENGYLFELEFSTLLRAQGSNGGQHTYSLKGTNESGGGVDVARLIIGGTDVAGTAHMDGITPPKTVPYTLKGGKDNNYPAQLSYLKMYLDMKHQTYSAWLVKRAGQDMPYSAVEPGEEDLLAMDVPFLNEIDTFTGLEIGTKNHYGGDRTDITFLKVNELDNGALALQAQAALTEESILGSNADAANVISDLTLPSVLHHCDITWTSDNENIISNTGAVTRPSVSAGDASVTLSAQIKRGEAQETQTFQLTVPADPEIVGPQPGTLPLIYNVKAAEGEPGYHSLTNENAVAIGVTSSTNTQIWSLESADQVSKLFKDNPKTMRFSTRTNVTGDIGGFDFTKFTENNTAGYIFDNAQNGYLFELEASTLLRPTVGKTGTFSYVLKGKNADGAVKDLAKITMSSTRPKNDADAVGTVAMQGGLSEVAYQTSDSQNTPVRYDYIKVYVDLKNQTTTAWLVKRQDKGGSYTETQAEKIHLLGADVPFLNEGIGQFTGLNFVLQENSGSDRTDIGYMRVSDLDCGEVVASAKAALEESDILNENAAADQITGNLTLPTTLYGAQIQWSSDKTNIAADGTVTRPGGADVPVVLTATIKRGAEAADTKEFHLTVLSDGSQTNPPETTPPVTTPPVATVKPGVAYYNFGAGENEDGYVNVSALEEEGITRTSCYGSPLTEEITLQTGPADADTALSGKTALVFSPNVKAGAAKTSLGKFDFTQKTDMNSEEGYLFEMEYSFVYRPQNTATGGGATYTLKGTDESGVEFPVASIAIQSKVNSGGNVRNGELYAGAANSARQTYPININGKAQPAQLSYIRIYVDLKNQTYTAYAMKQGDTQKEPQLGDLLVANAPFEGEMKIVRLTGMELSITENWTGDKTDISYINVRDLKDADLDAVMLSQAKAALNFDAVKGSNTDAQAVTSKLNLPSSFIGTNVAWTSSNTDVISNDGTVNRPAFGQADATVTLTAGLKRGTQTDTVVITVVVKAMDTNVTPEPNMGPLYYAASASAGEPGYVNVAADTTPDPASYGITLTDSWSFTSNKVNTAETFFQNSFNLNKYAFRVMSPKSTYTGTNPKVYAAFDFTKDQITGPYSFAEENGLYTFEMEFSDVLRPQGSAGRTYYRLKGLNTAGQSVNLASVIIEGASKATQGVIYAEGQSTQKKYLLNAGDGGAFAAQLSYLKVVVDLDAQTYSVWYVKRGEKNSYSEIQPAEEDLLAKDVRLPGNIAEITGFEVAGAGLYSGDRTDMTFMKMTGEKPEDVISRVEDMLRHSEVLGENTSMDQITANLNLPSDLYYSAIEWKTSDASVIALDGTVTRPTYAQGSRQVTLTASITRAGVTEDKEFQMKVLALGEDEYEPEPPIPTPPAVTDDSVIVADYMGYNTTDDIPKDGAFQYTADAAAYVSDLDSAVDRTDVGSVIGVNPDGSIEIRRADGGTLEGSIKKYVSEDKSNTGNITMELDYELIDSPALYLQIEGYGDWRGPITMTHSNGKLAPYGVSGGYNIDSKVKLVLQFKPAEKKLDIYANGTLVGKGVPYRNQSDANYQSNYDVGKVKFVLQKASPKNSGLKINAIRVYDTDKYAAYALSKDQAAVEAQMPPVLEVSDGQILNLPRTAEGETTEFGNTIAWTSSNSAVINPATGKVTADENQMQNVTLTATVTNTATGAVWTKDYSCEVSPKNLTGVAYIVKDSIPSASLKTEQAGGSVSVNGNKITLTKNKAGRVNATVIYDLGTGFDFNQSATTSFRLSGTTGQVRIKGISPNNKFISLNTTSIDGTRLTQSSGSSTYEAEGASFDLAYKIYPYASVLNSTVNGTAALNNVTASLNLGNLAEITFEIPADAPNGTMVIDGLQIYTDISKLKSMFETGIAPEKINSGSADVIQGDLSLPRTFLGQPIKWTTDNSKLDVQTGKVTPLTAYGYEKIGLNASVTINGQNFTKIYEPFTLVGKDDSLSTGKAASINVTLAAGSSADYLVDGSSYQAATTKGSEKSFDMVIDLGAGTVFNQVIIDEATNVINGYKIYVSDNGLNNWTEVASGTACGANKLNQFDAVTKRYVKVEVNGKTDRIPVTVSEVRVRAALADKDVVRMDREDLNAKMPKTINSDIELPVTGKYGSEITWKSSDTSIISNTGKFTKPTKSKTVTLTATLESGKESLTQSYRYPYTVSNSPGGGGGNSGPTSSNQTKPMLPDQVPVTTPAPTQNPVDTNFSDLYDVPWAAPHIKKLAAEGVVSGFDGKFRPDDNATREEFVKMMVTALGINTNNPQDMALKDVDANAWYYPYIAAAYQSKLVNGIGGGRFGIGMNITRQDMAVIIVNGLNATNTKLTPVKEAVPFADDSSISDYAKDSVTLLYTYGILSGDEANNFRPGDFATRAEIAKVISSIMG